MIVTKFNHLTTAELIALVRSYDNPTDMERELLRRLVNLLDGTTNVAVERERR